MCDALTNLLRKEWVSCLVLICFTFLCIRSSALPARPLPIISGKPHRTITYSRHNYFRCKNCALRSVIFDAVKNIDTILQVHNSRAKSRFYCYGICAEVYKKIFDIDLVLREFTKNRRLQLCKT